jgi:hypothetical protein
MLGLAAGRGQTGRFHGLSQSQMIVPEKEIIHQLKVHSLFILEIRGSGLFRASLPIIRIQTQGRL